MKTQIIAAISLAIGVAYAEPEQLTKVRSNYEQEQAKTTEKYVSWLKASLSKAMEAKNLDEVNAYQAELEKVTGEKSKVTNKMSVTDQLLGTTWRFWHEELIKFTNKATAKNGKDVVMHSWKVVDEQNRIIEGQHRGNNGKWRMTFNEDFTKGEVQYESGNVEPTVKFQDFDKK